MAAFRAFFKEKKMAGAFQEFRGLKEVMAEASGLWKALSGEEKGRYVGVFSYSTLAIHTVALWRTKASILASASWAAGRGSAVCGVSHFYALRLELPERRGRKGLGSAQLASARLLCSSEIRAMITDVAYAFKAQK